MGRGGNHEPDVGRYIAPSAQPSLQTKLRHHFAAAAIPIADGGPPAHRLQREVTLQSLTAVDKSEQ